MYFCLYSVDSVGFRRIAVVLNEKKDVTSKPASKCVCKRILRKKNNKILWHIIPKLKLRKEPKMDSIQYHLYM